MRRPSSGGQLPFLADFSRIFSAFSSLPCSRAFSYFSCSFGDSSVGGAVKRVAFLSKRGHCAEQQAAGEQRGGEAGGG
jgi:hypothetical protein